jgi:tetratricopeptide (TPR) repeat protein
MVKFRNESGNALADGVWGLHLVTPGTHQVTRFTSPLSLADFHSVHVAKITTDSVEALHAEPGPEPPPLVVNAPRVENFSAEEHHRLGRELLDKRNYREAITELSEAIREKSDFALAYNARGFAYYMLRDYRQANSDLDEAIRLNPAYLNAFQNRSHARRALGDLKGSAADANQARALIAKPR